MAKNQKKCPICGAGPRKPCREWMGGRRYKPRPHHHWERYQLERESATGMSKHVVIRPEDCPKPFWHKTHRYCPACSWMEPHESPIHAVAEIFHGAHVAWIDAAGVTGDLRGKANSLGGPCDECQALARLAVAETRGSRV